MTLPPRQDSLQNEPITITISSKPPLNQDLPFYSPVEAQQPTEAREADKAETYLLNIFGPERHQPLKSESPMRRYFKRQRPKLLKKPQNQLRIPPP